MFNIGFTEFLTIGVIALLVIGPKQLPEVACVVGRLLNELKRATQDLTSGLMEASHEIKDSFDEARREIVKETEKIKESVTNVDCLESSYGENRKDSDSEINGNQKNQGINSLSENKKS